MAGVAARAVTMPARPRVRVIFRMCSPRVGNLPPRPTGGFGDVEALTRTPAPGRGGAIRPAIPQPWYSGQLERLGRREDADLDVRRGPRGERRERPRRLDQGRPADAVQRHREEGAPVDGHGDA